MIVGGHGSGIGGQMNGNAKQVMTDSHGRRFATRRGRMGRMIGQGAGRRPEVKESALTRKCRESSRRPKLISGGQSNGRNGVLSVLTGARGLKIGVGPKIVRMGPNMLLRGSQPAKNVANRSCRK